ncbi:hypothetical protein QJS10_CPB15g01886 [Acorus calamus]|uniref:C2H2-type domain-containing protein n=1 Tax=Acorus calamus TaxID=4465 RepID=A0AAV9D908_ACOCL|nr:hypothetical protein QJS10_CPB15g01886 [Acorus calamus]
MEVVVSPTPPSPTGKQCGRTFDSLSALYGHMRMRKRKRGARKPRQEFLCYSEEVLNAATCLLMISRTHPEEEEEKRLYRCESCGRTFTTFQAWADTACTTTG